MTKGQLVCELDSVGAEGPAHQPGDRHPGGRGRLPERQAHPRGRRDRRHRVRRGRSSSRTWRPSRARSRWPSPTGSGPRTASTGRTGCSRRATSRRRRRSPTSSRCNGQVRPASRPRPRGACSRSTPRTRRSRSSRARSRRPAPTSWPSSRPGAGEVEGSEAREADRELQALRPRRRPGRLRQRPEPLRRQQPAADRGRGDRPRAAEDLQPARHHQDAGQHQGPRVDGRPDHAGPPRPDPGRCLRRPGPDRRGRGRRPPARPEQLLQLGRQGLHHPRHDREGPPRAPAGDDGAGRDPGHRAAGRPERPGPGGPRIQGQGPRRRQEPATITTGRSSRWGSPTTSSSRSRRGSRPATSSRSTRSR